MREKRHPSRIMVARATMLCTTGITRKHEYTRARAAGGRRSIVGALRSTVARVVAAHEHPERIQCARRAVLVDRNVGRTGTDGTAAGEHPQRRERSHRQWRAAHGGQRADLSVLAAPRRRCGYADAV